MQHFNELTPAEQERLAMLAEEAGEIVQIVGKILRHGYESYHPDQAGKAPQFRHTNRDALDGEIADFTAVLQMMENAQDVNLSTDAVETAMVRKLRYTHHQ